MFCVVSYDITDDGRREKIAKTLLDYGTRVQYSVFECIMDDEALTGLGLKLGGIVSGEDSVRIYTLCARCEKAVSVLGAGKVTKDENVYIL
jgi:CRISPR-associated protein Cas2